jgi:hypothetical protein
MFISHILRLHIFQSYSYDVWVSENSKNENFCLPFRFLRLAVILSSVRNVTEQPPHMFRCAAVSSLLPASLSNLASQLLHIFKRK